MAFEAWELAMIDEAGYNGIRPEHVRRVGDEINKLPQDNIDTAAFEAACRCAFVNPKNFTQQDLDKLQDYLNQF